MNLKLQKQSIVVKDLGLVEYSKAYEIQKQWVDRVIAGQSPVLILCEHPAVLTLGRLASQENFRMPKETIEKIGIAVLNIDRGGEVTLHSPGQLVVYPILDLRHYGKDLRRYLHGLEQVGIDLLKDFGILADRFSGRTGVWAGPQKIVSIGIGVKKWVSFHGMAVNVNTDLSLFELINPCGLKVQMTSIEKMKQQQVSLELVKGRLIERFCEHFDLRKV